MHIISGIHKNKQIIAPKGDATRPTSNKLRETLFNICQGYIEEAEFLDLFAGSGAMGLEALSRGANKATFIDNSKDSIRCIKANLEKLKMEDCSRVLYGDVFQQIKKLAELGYQYDIIYADPPYDTTSKEEGKEIANSARVLKMVDESVVLKPLGVLFIEDSRDSKPATEGLRTLIFKSSRQMGRSVLQQYQKRG